MSDWIQECIDQFHGRGNGASNNFIHTTGVVLNIRVIPRTQQHAKRWRVTLVVAEHQALVPWGLPKQNFKDIEALEPAYEAGSVRFQWEVACVE